MLDIEYLNDMNIKNNLKPPSENSKEAFVERICIAIADTTNNQSIDIVRRAVYSSYIWGLVGDLPEPI